MFISVLGNKQLTCDSGSGFPKALYLDTNIWFIIGTSPTEKKVTKNKAHNSLIKMLCLLMNHVRKAKDARKTKFGSHTGKDVQNTPSNPCIRWLMNNERVEENMEKRKDPTQHPPP